MTFTLLRRGELIPVPPPERATEFLRREGRLDGAGGQPHRRGIVGSPETVRAGLEALVAEYQADEVIAVTITFDHEARRQSYELLAEVMDLQPGDLQTAA
jgi:alkanesulfonate monooxygenase SsuD/methylene tetrahydromethanopterin reductase-like flavin-dependent oxidoreductase (luciferase family)